MKRLVLLAVLALILMGWVFAQTKTEERPCLIVQSIAGNRLNGLSEGGVLGMAITHGERFPYLESRNLKVHDVKDQYKKKDLEKLEEKGVKVVITNGSQRRGRADISVSATTQNGIDADLAAARRSCDAQ